MSFMILFGISFWLSVIIAIFVHKPKGKEVEGGEKDKFETFIQCFITFIVISGLIWFFLHV